MKNVIYTTVLLAFGVAHAEPAFKGVPFGASIAEFTAAHPAFQCFADPRAQGATLCSAGLEACRKQRYGCAPRDYEASRYADEQVDMIIAAFPSGTFERLEVYFPSRSYEAIAKALRDRHGNPQSKSTATARSVSGGVGQDETLVWDSPAGFTTISRYGSTLVQGMLTAVSPRYLADAPQRDATRDAKRRAGM